MSSFSDIVKYGATLILEREKSGHKTSFIVMVIFGALFMLTFQIILIVSLNYSNDKLLFCGDVIDKVEPANADPIALFADSCV